MGLMGGDAIGGAYAGYRNARNAKKAQKQRMKYLSEGLNQFKAGSSDVFGNKLSADKNGLWSYNLSNTGKSARDSASRAINAMNNYQNKSSRDLYAQDLASLINANNSVANANQASAMKSALRQGSNIGYISNAYNQAKSKNIANAMRSALNSANNSLKYNTNMRNMLANSAQNSMIPINSMQGNLQRMVNSLNKSVMDQYNNLAGAVQAKPDSLISALQGADKGFNESLSQLDKLLKLFKN